MYNFKSNVLDIVTKNHLHFNFKMRGKITIVSGYSGTGKTFVSNYLREMTSSKNVADKEFKDVFVLNSDNCSSIFTKESKLIVIDRAELLLTPEIVDFINSDYKNKYLIFARGTIGINASPNYYATINKSGNEFCLQYDFDEKGWY